MPKTPKQLIDQSTRHQVYLEMLKTGEYNKLRAILEDSEDNLVGMLTRKDFKTMSPEQIKRRLYSMRSMLRQRYDEDMIPALNKSIRELAVYEAEFESRSLGKVVDYNFELPSEDQIISAVRTRPLSVRGPDNGKLLTAFIRDWTESQVTRTTNTIRAGFVEGQTTPQIVRRLRDEVGPINRRGLQALTRTALQHCATQAREQVWRRNQDIVKRVQWVSTIDSRTTTQCQALDLQVFKLDEGPRPPIHPGCLSGDTHVATRSPVFNAYKRPYKGILVDIKTASGRTLSITPNHPVLTKTGWKPAGEINCSDKLIRVTNVAGGADNNKYCVNSKFSDFFSTLKVMVDPSFISTSPAAAEDFHGDGIPNTDVEIINVKSFGWDCVREVFANKIKNNRFPFRLRAMMPFKCFGSFYSFFARGLSAASRFMSIFCKLGNFRRSHFGHAGILLFTSIAGLVASVAEKFSYSFGACSETTGNPGSSNPGFMQRNYLRSVDGGQGAIVFSGQRNPGAPAVPIKGVFGNATNLASLSRFNALIGNKVNSFLCGFFSRLATGLSKGGDALMNHSICEAGDGSALLDGKAGLVEFDCVVNVGRIDFSGHVYNLQNSEGWYLANDIIVHNCRSTIVAQLDERFKFLDEGGTRRTRDPVSGDVGSTKASETYYSWLRDQPKSVQDSIIGPTRGKLLREGGLSSQRFAELQLSKNYKPLTLDEMKKLEPVAFEKAGIE